MALDDSVEEGKALVQYVKGHINKSLERNKEFGPEYVEVSVAFIDTFLDSGPVADVTVLSSFSTIHRAIAEDFVSPEGKKASFLETRKACVAIAHLCRTGYQEGIAELRRYSQEILETRGS